jgi:hypothetical protein
MAAKKHRSRPPTLYRSARAIRRVSAILLVVVLVYAGVAVYSGLRFAQGVQSGASHRIGGFSTRFTPQQTLDLSAQYPINNSGALPVSGLSIELAVRNPSGALVTQGGTSGVQIPAGGSASIPFNLVMSLSSTSPAAALLISDQNLSISIWANLTYAYLFPVQLTFHQNYGWGAPFAGLSATFGTPFSLPNGTVGTNATLSFSYHLNLTMEGHLSITLLSSGGATCGVLTYPMNLQQGTNYQSTQTAYLAPGCSPLGGTAQGLFTGPSYSFALPPLRIPA